MKTTSLPGIVTSDDMPASSITPPFTHFSSGLSFSPSSLDFSPCCNNCRHKLRENLKGTWTWNNGKEVPRLDLTSSTMPGQQIHKFDHTQTANPCDWLPCRRVALPLVSCPHSLVYLHLPVVEGLIFCISATPHLGTSFPLFHALS